MFLHVLLQKDLIAKCFVRRYYFIFVFCVQCVSSYVCHAESELRTVLFGFGQDMRAKIFAFVFNQFSFSGVHWGVKQYGKFNFYVGLVNGVSWYFTRLKLKGNKSLFWGVKIELSIPFYVWKWFAVLQLNREISFQQFDMGKLDAFYFWCPSIYFLNFSFRYVSVDFINLPHVFFCMKNLYSRSWRMVVFFCFFAFIPAVTFDLTRLANKFLDLHLRAVYEMDSVWEMQENMKKENSIEKDWEEIMQNNFYIDEDDDGVALYLSDYEDEKKRRTYK